MPSTPAVVVDRWNSRAMVHCWADLVRLSGCSSEREFLAALWEEVEPDPGIDDVGDGVMLHMVGRAWETLYYPFPVRSFWRLVSQLESEAYHWHSIASLPWFDEGQDAADDCTDDLATFFNVPLNDFVSVLGGGWRAHPLEDGNFEFLDENGLVEFERCFSRGDPVTVILRIVQDAAAVFVLGGAPAHGEPQRAEVLARVPLRKSDTLARIATAVAESERLEAFRAELARLRIDHDCTSALAALFGTPVVAFAGAAGGAWRLQDAFELVTVEGASSGWMAAGEALPVSLPTDEKPWEWFVSGEPVQVLLGVGSGAAFVVHPTPIRAGMAGPGVIELGRTWRVSLGDPRAVDRLGRAVGQCVRLRRRELGMCGTCRTVTEGGDTPHCADCLSRYWGVIFD